jgi:crossover junction endodeoxyribonuclease RuvC
MIIFGLDPGTLVTGYGVVETHSSTMKRIASGALVLDAKKSLALRLATIYSTIISVFDSYHPDEFCIETAFYSKNVQSTLKLGHVKGVALLAAVHRDVPITEYSPREVKRAVTGNGNASKQQVQYMIKTLLGIDTDFRYSDEADGLAVALCHAIAFRVPRKKSGSWEAFINENPGRVRG